MIIDKTGLTPKERRRIQELSPKIREYILEAPAHDYGDSSIKSNPAFVEYCAILDAAEERYITSIMADYGAIMANVREIVGAYTAQDYTNATDPVAAAIKKELSVRKEQLAAAGDDPEKQAVILSIIAEDQERLRDNFSFSYISIYNCLKRLTGPELKAIERGQHPGAEYSATLEKRARELESELSDRETSIEATEETGEQMTLFPEDEERIKRETEVLYALPRLLSVIPQKHLIPNNKLANSLTKDIIDTGLVALDVGKKKGDITTRCILSYDGDNVKLSSRQPFTEYDRQVADAVTSLYEYGDQSHVVTASTVYRAMVHATETETPSPQQIGAVTRSLDKLRFVRVQIDCSEEIARRNISLNGSQITGGKVDTYLLAMDKLEVVAGGQRVAAYKLIKAPILYDYSRLTGQVLTVPASLLDIRDETGAKVANTDRRIAIKGYLMRRISVMQGKTGSGKSRHIKYDTVYTEVCDGKELTRRDQQLIREYIAAVLDDWTRNSFIKGYTETQEGRKKTGVEIKL